MYEELGQQDIESLPLPNGWAKSVRHAVLNILGIVRFSLLMGREFLIQEGDMPHARISRLETEVALLREQLRINGSRMT